MATYPDCGPIEALRAMPSVKLPIFLERRRPLKAALRLKVKDRWERMERTGSEVWFVLKYNTSSVDTTVRIEDCQRWMGLQYSIRTTDEQ